MKPKLANFLVLAIPCVLFLSCVKMSPPSLTSLKEANQKFLNLCREEFHAPVELKTFKNTIWVYVPLEGGIFDFKSTPEGPRKEQTSLRKPAVHFSDVQFADNTFTIKYDISTQNFYKLSPGYKNAYSEKFSRLQNNILTAAIRSYTSVEEIPGDISFEDYRKQQTHEQLVNAYVKKGRVPDFFVFVFADIQTGIVIKSVVYWKDLKQAFSGLPGVSQEEATKRFATEIFGQQSFVGDREGESLSSHDMTWPEFLSLQIQNRITFKYQQSDFPPSERTQDELLAIVARTIRYYNFDDFEFVKLTDLSNGQTSLFDKNLLWGLFTSDK